MRLIVFIIIAELMFIAWVTSALWLEKQQEAQAPSSTWSGGYIT